MTNVVTTSITVNVSTSQHMPTGGSVDPIAWVMEMLRSVGVEGDTLEDVVMEAASQLQLMNCIDWSRGGNTQVGG